MICVRIRTVYSRASRKTVAVRSWARPGRTPRVQSVTRAATAATRHVHARIVITIPLEEGGPHRRCPGAAGPAVIASRPGQSGRVASRQPVVGMSAGAAQGDAGLVRGGRLGGRVLRWLSGARRRGHGAAARSGQRRGGAGRANARFRGVRLQRRRGSGHGSARPGLAPIPPNAVNTQAERCSSG